jgi:predicted transcriptional regulator
MYSLRLTPKGKHLIEECAEICGIPLSKVLRIVAYWVKTGRVRITDAQNGTVEITKKNKNVIKINVSENYYKNVTEIITVEMPEPPTANQRDFRIMLSAACLDVVTDHAAEHRRIKAIDQQNRAGIDYNVPERILELRELASAGQRS